MSRYIHPCVKIGNNVKIGNIVDIGENGFNLKRNSDGTLEDKTCYYGVIIENDVTIDSFTNIDRGMFRDTIIGKGTKMDAHVHISHDCIIGKHCEIDPGVIILGEAEIGDYSRLCSGCIIQPKVKIGKNCVVGAGSYLRRDLKDNEIAYGMPAKPVKNTNYSKFRKQFSLS